MFLEDRQDCNWSFSCLAQLWERTSCTLQVWVTARFFRLQSHYNRMVLENIQKMPLKYLSPCTKVRKDCLCTSGVALCQILQIENCNKIIPEDGPKNATEVLLPFTDVRKDFYNIEAKVPCGCSLEVPCDSLFKIILSTPLYLEEVDWICRRFWSKFPNHPVCLSKAAVSAKDFLLDFGN